MAVSSEHALREAELLTLRQISDAMRVTNDSLKATNKTIEGLRDDVGDARERLVRIEAQNEARVDLRDEVESLKKDLQQRIGAGKLFTLLKDFTPWILGLGAAMLAAAGKLHIG